MNIGKNAEAEFERIFRSYGKSAYLYRIKDAADIKGRSRTAAHVVVPPVPADYLIGFGGNLFFAEIKATTKPRFSFDMLEPYQRGSAERLILIGYGLYLVFVYHVKTGIWYRLPYEVIAAEREAKSLAWELLKPYIWSVNS